MPKILIAVVVGSLIGLLIAGAAIMAIPKRPQKDDPSPPIIEPIQAAEKTPEPEKPVVSVQAEAIYGDYRVNPFEADAKYKGKMIEVIGMVKGFQTEMTSRSRDYMEILAASDFDAGFDRPAGIRCFAAATGRESFAKASASKIVRVRGICKGREANSSAYYKFIVILEQCHVVEVTNPPHPKRLPPRHRKIWGRSQGRAHHHAAGQARRKGYIVVLEDCFLAK